MFDPDTEKVTPAARPRARRLDMTGVRMVELRGIEPLTYSMRTSRATNCAIAPEGRRATNREPL